MQRQFSEPIHLVNSQNQLTITIDNETGTIKFFDSGGRVRATLNNKGELSIVDSNEKPTLKFEANKADVIVGARANPGKIFLMDGVNDSSSTVQISGDNGSIHLGNQSQEGGVYVNGKNGAAISLNGSSGKIMITKAQNSFEVNEDGNILSKFENTERLKFDAKNSILYLGDFYIGGKNAIKLDGKTGDIVSKNNKAEVFKFDSKNAILYLGNEDQHGNLHGNLIVRNGQGKATIKLDGKAGDITLPNADFAEDFDIAMSSFNEIEPGTVMVLNHEGKLKACKSTYDKKVAGIISGAGSYKPGITLDKHPEVENRLPIALSGKVYCKVDASFGSIEVGDLLTTSATTGHAMKAQNNTEAFGSVIGKALAPLMEGRGLIPVLVSLQ